LFSLFYFHLWFHWRALETHLVSNRFLCNRVQQLPYMYKELTDIICIPWDCILWWNHWHPRDFRIMSFSLKKQEIVRTWP
jgi:hypothetical protein